MEKKSKKSTIKQWIFRMIFCGLVVMTVVFFIVPWYTGARMRDQVRENSEQLTKMYLSSLDNSVSGINKVLSQFAASSYDVSVLARSQDKMDRYMSKVNVMRKLADAAMIYNVFDGIFVYSQSAAEDAFLCQVGVGGNGTQVSQMKEIMKTFEAKYSLNAWEFVKYEDKQYLVRVVKTGATSCGAWIDAASLTNPLRDMGYDENSMVLFLDEDGRVLNGAIGALAGETHLSEENNGQIVKIDKKRYLQTMEPSRFLPVTMAVLVPEVQYMRDTYLVQNVIGLLMLAGLLVLPILGRLMTKNISEPVSRFIASMEDVSEGNLEVRVEPEGTFREFDELAVYFNNMVSELKRLKRDVYDRKIREQKIELQYLQTQVRPHFFLNTLNVIYSFSLVGRNDLIERMVVCLSKYFGYRFKSTDSFVTLGEEKEHIENYLELHRLRYQNKFLCQLEIEDVLLDAKLPPLVIQTFVENSLKYGLSQDRVFEIEIVAEVMMIEDVQKLKITISDNGPGYEKEVLAEAAEGKVKHGHGQGIGINNVIQRLHLIYGGGAKVLLSNIPGGGACSEIIMPLEFAEETEDVE